jgi:hypothetical protein
LVLIGGREVLPYGGAIVKSGKITMRVLPPIETAQLSLKDRDTLTEKVHDLILAELVH